MSSDFWNERYSRAELVYGEAPNEFLVEAAKRFLKPSPNATALDIGAGEGRNALFLASLGYQVLAVDQSEVGMQKAARLARERGLHLRTRAVDLREYSAADREFDVVSSIFVHLPGELRAAVHAGVTSWLKLGGVFVLEAYAPDQIGRETGGPKDPALLASLETILCELDGLEILHRAALVRNVVEGVFHGGEASVVQLVGRRR